MESKGAKFINDVSRAFKSQAAKSPSRYRLLDGTQTPDDVEKLIWKEVEPLLK
jgi:thymidylate kinase